MSPVRSISGLSKTSNDDSLAHYVISGVVGVVGATLLVGGQQAGQLNKSSEPIGPGFLPMALGGLLLIFAVALIIATRRRVASVSPPLQSRTEKTENTETFGHTSTTLMVDCGLLIGYCLVLEYLGFIIATFTYLLVALSVIRSGGMVAKLLIAFAFVATTYVLFEVVLGVRLPVSIIPGTSI